MSIQPAQSYSGTHGHVGQLANSEFRHLASQALPEFARAAASREGFRGDATSLPEMPSTRADSDQLEILFDGPPESSLVSYARLLGQRYATDPDTALALVLAAAAGAIGRGRQIVNPLGGVLPASLNVMVLGTGTALGRHVLDCATKPLVDLAAHYAGAKSGKGPQRLRQERVALEQRATAVRERLAKLRMDLAQAGTAMDLSLAGGSTASREALQQEGEEVSRRLMELEVEERPWLISDGLSLSHLRDLATRSYDRSLLNFSPDGMVWESLAGAKATAQGEILHILNTGFHGKPMHLLADGLTGGVISNLWLLDPSRCRGRALAAIREDPLWGTFLFADIRDLEADLEVALLERSGLDDWWAEHIFHLFEARVMKPPSQVVLSAEASKSFIEFCNQHRLEKRSLPPDEQRMAGARPQQMLKLALLIHLCGEQPDAPVIETETLKTAVALVTRLAQSASWKTAQTFARTPVTVEVEIERMAMKVRIHGPMSKREIFRRYDSQDYGRLEPILQKALEANLIQSDGKYFTSLN